MDEPIFDDVDSGIGFILVVGFIILLGIVGGLAVFSIF